METQNASAIYIDSLTWETATFNCVIEALTAEAVIKAFTSYFIQHDSLPDSMEIKSFLKTAVDASFVILLTSSGKEDILVTGFVHLQ